MTLRSPTVHALWLSLIALPALAQPRQSVGISHKAGASAETPPNPTLDAKPNAGDAATQAERDKQARLEFQQGRKAFDEGDYRAAWGFFHNAYRLSGRAELLYNVGQTADRLGRDSEALQAFRMYLERLPKAENRREVENRIRALEERVKDAERLPPPPTREQTALDPAPPPTAAVEPVQPQPEPQTAQVALPPPPPPPKASGPRPTRKEFYLRFGLGAGVSRDGVSGGTDGTVSGINLAGEVAAGYAIWPGLVVGGAIYSDLASSPTFKGENGVSLSLGAAHLWMLGPMADWYVRPRDNGFHVQAALTFAAVSVDYKTAGFSVGRNASGIGALLGVGYEWPISSEVAVGALGRVGLASLTDDQRTHGMFTPSLLATLTWY